MTDSMASDHNEEPIQHWQFYETIAAAKANKHNNIDIALRDISRAFDKVWHDGLKFKTLQLNLPQPLTRIIADYISRRTA